MPTPRPARSVKKPVVAKRVSAKRSITKKKPVTKNKPIAKKKPAGEKAAPKPVVKKSAKPKSARAIKQGLKAKRDAAVEKRNQTIAATNCTVGAEPVAVEPTDEAARAAIDKRQVCGRRTAVDRMNDPPNATGIALVERVTRAVERELSQIEVIVGGHHVNVARRTEAERRARTLASLARTLTEVRRLRAEEDRLKQRDDDVRPRNTPEFRLELARRLDRLVAEAKAVHPDEGE
jgi:hypothetical protein